MWEGLEFVCITDGKYKGVGQGWLTQASRMKHKPLLRPALWKGRVKSCWCLSQGSPAAEWELFLGV